MTMQMAITTIIGCKNMCLYCPQKKIISAYKDKERMMSFDTYKKCLDKMPKDMILSFGGMSEAFLNPDCIKMIEYTSQKGFKIRIFSTSVGMTKDIIHRLEKIPISSFVFHLPDNINNTKIKVDEVFLENLKLIKESKISNIHYQIFGKLHPKVKKVLNMEIEDQSRMLEARAGNLEEGRQRYLKGKIICSTAGKKLNRNSLLPNGDVFICCQDWGLEHKFGNLLKNSYEDLFKSKEFYNVQSKMNSEFGDVLCRRCEYARVINSKKYKFGQFARYIGLVDFLYSFKKIPIVKKIYVWWMNKTRNKKRFNS